MQISAGNYRDDLHWWVVLRSSTGITVKITCFKGDWQEDWSQDEVWCHLRWEAQELAQEWADRKAQEAWLNETAFRLRASTIVDDE